MKASKIITFFVFTIICVTWHWGCNSAPGGVVSTGYDEAGPYGVVRLLNQGVGTVSTGVQGYAPLCNDNDPSAFTLYYPEGGEEGESFPLLTWGNGTLTTPTFYDEIIGHVVSYGFIVICTNTGTTGTGEEMLEAVEWAIQQNSEPGSPIYGMVDCENIGAFGHSQGGFGTCMTGADPRIDAIAPLSGVPVENLLDPESLDLDCIESIQCPAFFLTTADEYTGSSGMGLGVESAFNAVDVLSVFAVTADGDHGEYQDVADNISFPGVTSNDGLQTRGAVAAWFDWQLKGKSELKSYFFGEDCELCNSPNCSIVMSKEAADGGNDSECTELVEYTNILAPDPDTEFTGPYDVVIEGDPNFPTHTIIRPRNIDKPMPILSWGEGGCVKFGRSYAEMMGEVASYGIIVIADGGPKLTDLWGGASCTVSPGNMIVPSGEALVMGIDYAFEKNDDPCSPLYQHVDKTRVAVSGQSCGGLLALSAAADARVTVTFIMSSGIFFAEGEYGRETILPQIHTPVMYLNGGPTDAAYSQATDDIAYLKELAANGQFDYPILWANRGIGHMADILTDNGGTFGAFLSDWLRYQFFGDRAEMFEGDDCGYCEDNDHSSELWTLDKCNGEKLTTASLK